MKQTILVLDDEPDNVLLLEETFKRALPEVRTVAFTSPQAAAAWCETNEPDLCLIDYKMPGMSGIEFLALVRQQAHFASVPIIMLTAQPGSELQQQALNCGATDFLSKPMNVADVVARTRNHLRLRAGPHASHRELEAFERAIQQDAQRLVEQEQTRIIQRLTQLSGYRDEETGNHMRRMAHIAVLIAEDLGLDKHFREMLLLAAPMHDIGKVGIPDRILLKPGRLDAAEWTVMQTHTNIGYDLLKDFNSEMMRLGAEVAHSHHEKYNGTGYPLGLAGEAIPLVGRVVAVADVFDALVNVRHYKPAWNLGEALDLLRRESGQHFDPACVTALLRRTGEVMDIQNQYTDPGNSLQRAANS